MIQYFVKRSASEALQEVKQPQENHAWVYVSGATEKELQSIIDTYELDGDIVHDVHDKHELPRIEYSGGGVYVFLRTPHHSSWGGVVSSPFLAILKGGVLITVATGEYATPAEVLQTSTLTTKNNKHVFVELLSHVVNQYQEDVRRTGTYILNTSQRLRTRDIDNKDFIHFVTVESDLSEYNTSLSGIAVVLDRLHENRHDILTKQDCELIEDIILLINQLLVAVQSHGQTINSIRNAYTTISNNNLNQRMKTLTLVTILITLPNVFYGMYGMNVALPFAEQPWAYAAITAFTLVIVLLVYAIVRRLRF